MRKSGQTVGRIRANRAWILALSAFAGAALAGISLAPTALAQPASPGNEANDAADEIVLNDDGAWCWFQDERAVIHQGNLIVGSVANGRSQPDRQGDIDLTVFNLASGNVRQVTLHDQLQPDDHNAPALLVRPDGRLLAVYAKHGPEDHFYYRITKDPENLIDWGPVQTFTPSPSSRVTYSNLHLLAAEGSGSGRIYNFYRGLDNSFKPSYATSDDLGQTWTSGNVVINVPSEFRHRPYVKYASNGRDCVHLVYTEGHPRNYDNSLYHIVYRSGQLHGSAGSPISTLAEGLERPELGTKIFQGDPDNVAWSNDLQLDDRGRPYSVFSVQKDSAGLPPAEGGTDHRYHYAWWDGQRWHDHEVAFAGTRLYPREDDYTGLICLDPDDLRTVYISTDADPESGQPLISGADNRRHYEIYRGSTADGGQSWSWTAITSNSDVDNLRPIVPRWNSQSTALLWYRGEYRTYTSYDTEIVLKVLD